MDGWAMVVGERIPMVCMNIYEAKKKKKGVSVKAVSVTAVSVESSSNSNDWTWCVVWRVACCVVVWCVRRACASVPFCRTPKFEVK